MNRLLTLVVTGLSLAVGSLSALAAEFDFKLHHLLSAKAPAHTKMLEPWAKAVEANAGGRVKIELFPSMSLGGKPPELVQQARDGVVDIVWTVNGYTPGLFPRTEVFELPTVFVNDPRATNLAMQEMFADTLEQEYKGLKVMWLHVHSGQGIHMVEKEVRSPADMKGLKMRIPTRTGAWIIEALGAAPVAMPVPELPQALSKKVVDGAFIPWEIIPPLKIQDQTEYQIEGEDMARFGTTTFQVSMNKARWNPAGGYPESLHGRLRPDWWAEVGEIWRAADDFGIGLAVKAGNTHITLTRGRNRPSTQPLRRWSTAGSRKSAARASTAMRWWNRARALIAKHSSKVP